MVSEHGYPKEIIDSVLGLVEDLEVHVIPEPQDYQEMIRIAVDYHLLPSDAIIVLTCKHYGIRKIMSFDEDFRRAPGLKVVQYLKSKELSLKIK